MKPLRTDVTIIGFAALIAIAVAGVAAAGQLFTPPLYVNSGENVACEIANVDHKAHTVAINVVNSAGAVVSSFSTTLAAGRSTQEDFSSTGGRYYCSFIFSGDNEDFRASIARWIDGESISDLNGFPATGTSSLLGVFH